MKKQKPEEGMDTVRKPTDAEMAKGPVYGLRRDDWRSHDQNWHGLDYPVKFRGGYAEIYGPHFERWLGDEWAAKLRIKVTKPGKS